MSMGAEQTKQGNNLAQARAGGISGGIRDGCLGKLSIDDVPLGRAYLIAPLDSGKLKEKEKAQRGGRRMTSIQPEKVFVLLQRLSSRVWGGLGEDTLWAQERRNRWGEDSNSSLGKETQDAAKKSHNRGCEKIYFSKQ